MLLPDNKTHIILGSCDINEDIFTGYVWQHNTFRQDTFSVHSATESVIGVWGTTLDDITKLDTYYTFQSIFDKYTDAVKEASSRYYNKKFDVMKSMFVKLHHGGNIPTHIDTDGIFNITHRIHIPIITNSEVEFIVDDKEIDMKTGSIIEINNKLPHGVINNSDNDRVHFICDLIDIGE